jgi:localization factor PodJL
MPVDSQRPGQIGGERELAGGTGPSNGLENLLQRLTDQLAENERRHADSLRDVHSQLRQLEKREIAAPGATVDLLSRDQPFESSAMHHSSPSRGRLGAHARPPAASPFHDADQPWDIDSADALSRLYEGPEAEAPRSAAPHRAPIDPPFDSRPEPSHDRYDEPSFHESPRDRLAGVHSHFEFEQPAAARPLDQLTDPMAVHARLADVAVRIEAALLELRPQNHNHEILERFSRFEKRLTGVLDNVASRAPGGEGLRRVEAQVGTLASQLNQTRTDLARLDRIEEQLGELRDRLSDDEIVRLFGSLVPSEEDLVRFAEDAAGRTAARFAADEARRDKPAAGGAGANAPDEQFEALYTLLSSFIDESRRSDHVTSDALETVQSALQQVLDRVEALEVANAGARGSQPMAPRTTQHAPGARHVPSEHGDTSVDFVPPRSAEQDYSFADQNGPVLQPIVDAHGTHHARDFAGAVPQQDRFADGVHADTSGHAPRTAGAPRGPMDRKQMIEMARRAAETARVASAEQAEAAAGKRSKDRLGIVAAGKQSKSAVRPGLLIAASVAAFLLAGSFFILGPKLRSSNAPTAARPAPVVVESSGTASPRGAGPEINEDAKPTPTEPVAPERRSMVPVVPEREAGHIERAAAPRNFASGESIDVARFGIAIQENPNRPNADEVIRARQRAHIAGLSERTGFNAAHTAAAVAEPAALVTGATEVAPMPVSRRPPPTAQESRIEVAMPPIMIGPSSLRSAAASGDASAQFEVASRYAEGKGVPKSFEQAAIWYQRAAAQGLSQAQYRLATLYERGWGIKADLERARVWYKRAADQGNVKAMHNLAVMSTNRELGTPDYAAAARYFERAAEHGLADSQFNLGVLYETGQGVQADRVTAYKWYGRAAMAGDRDAERRRDQLRLKLDSASITKGERLISEWRSQPTDPIANEARTAGDAWKRREAKASE